jgi:hypothetical protein
MDPDTQAAADRRLEEALAATGARDPRPACREALREIRRRSEDEYAEAVGEYRESVIRGITQGDADPVLTWIEFGVRLADRLAPGKTLAVDGDGRARDYAWPPAGSELIVHLPNDRGTRAIPVALPSVPTLAQRATVQLLAHGRVKLTEAMEDESRMLERT